jgi:hypothetical protein
MQAAVDISFVSLSFWKLGVGDAKGIGMGKLGLEVADFGKDSISGVSPGTKTTTIL